MINFVSFSDEHYGVAVMCVNSMIRNDIERMLSLKKYMHFG